MKNIKPDPCMKDGKLYNFIKRSRSENMKISDLLHSAYMDLHKVMWGIEYKDFPNLNHAIYEHVRELAWAIDKLNDDIMIGNECIYKPRIDSSKSMYYYELGFFYTRTNRGSTYIISRLCVKDYETENEFLQALVDEKTISSDLCEHIISVIEIDEDEYEYKTEEEK